MWEAYTIVAKDIRRVGPRINLTTEMVKQFLDHLFPVNTYTTNLIEST